MKPAYFLLLLMAAVAWAVLVNTHLPYPARFSLASEPSVVGDWTLCATQVVNDGRPPSEPWGSLARPDTLGRTKDYQVIVSDTTVIRTYSCTQVVFHANGAGYANLEGGTPHPFTWRQEGTALTMAYRGEPTRLEGGVHRLRFVSLPGKPGTPASTRLELSAAPGTTHFLER